MLISPNSFYQVASKYQKHKAKFVISTISLFIIMLLAGSQSQESTVFTWIYFVSAIFAAQAFFISGFLFTFKNLDSKNSIHPFWYKVTIAKEWIYVIAFVIFLAMPTYMLLSLLINGVTAT